MEGQALEQDTDGSGVRIDPDVDLHVRADRDEIRANPWPVLLVISVGGMVGALARYFLQHVWPHQAGGFPWATFVINVSGSLCIGVLMALIDELPVRSRLVRPFVGVGILGGFTTFSTYAVDIQQSLGVAAARIALVYLTGTLVAALVAVWIGNMVTIVAVRRVRSAG
jgi:CrcB protein